MACWPANIVGSFFIALLVFDSIVGDYEDLLPHSVVGVITTLVFWLICFVLGEQVSGAVLVVPSVFATIFLFSLWFFGQSMKNRGYCISSGRRDTCTPPGSAPAPMKSIFGGVFKENKSGPPPADKPKCPPPKPKS